MDQTYVILKPEQFGGTTRDVLFRFGKFCYRDEHTNLGVKVLTLDNFSLVLKVLQQRQGSMPFLCRDNDLHLFPQFSAPIEDATASAMFVRDELLRNEDKLQTLSEFGMTAWIDDDFGAFYLELGATKTHAKKLENVEMIVAKVFVERILWCILYHEGKFLITLQESLGEHELLDTNFPKVNNPKKIFPLEQYLKHDSWTKLSLLHSPLSSHAAAKTADFEDLEHDDSDGEEESPCDTEIVMKDTKNIFEEGYHQSYIVRRPSCHSTRRNVFVRCGNWCYDGEVDLGQMSLALSDIPMAIPILQAQQSSLRYVNEFGRLRKRNPCRRALMHLSYAAAFIEEHASSPASIKVLEQMECLSFHNQGHSFDSGNENIVTGEVPKEYFELQVAPESKGYEDIELAATKTYVRGVIMVLIYFDGCIYATLADGEGDQPLLDVAFPDMSRKGGGCQLGTFDHPHFVKLCVWQGTACNFNVSPSKKANLIDNHRSNFDQVDYHEPIGTGNSLEREGDATLSKDGQTYMIFKHGNSPSPTNLRCSGTSKRANEREAFFRFGGWCYTGSVDFDVEPGQMSLEMVKDILPTLAAQQRGMSFSTECGALSDRSKVFQAMKRLELAADFILEQLAVASDELQKLKDLLVGNGQQPWIDGEGNDVYFEVQMTAEGAEMFAEIEVVCSKFYTKGILLSMIYIASTLFITISDADGEHALLDSSFPDVSVKARGYNLGIKDHAFFKKFSIWERTPTDGRDNEEPDKFPSIKPSLLGVKESVDKKTRFLNQCGRTESNDEGNFVDCALTSESTTSEQPVSLNRMATFNSRVKPPHRLAPMKNNPGLKSGSTLKLKSLKPLGHVSVDSPWDEFGRPKGTKALGSRQLKK